MSEFTGQGKIVIDVATVLPEYTGSSEMDRAEYLLQNADAIVEDFKTKREAAKQKQIEGRQNRFCEAIPQSAKFMSDLQRAAEMAATRGDRLGAAIDEAFSEEEVEIFIIQSQSGEFQLGESGFVVPVERQLPELFDSESEAEDMLDKIEQHFLPKEYDYTNQKFVVCLAGE